MAKQKEIKFRRDGKLFYGQQNGVKYSIHEARRLHEDESEQYYVSVNYPNERHRSFTTNGYRTFDLDGAKAFCQQVAAGEFDPAPIHAAQAAAKAEREKAALEHAAKQAAAFQGKLDAHRLDFSTLLELIHCYKLHVGDQARLLLTEWEQQKAELNTDKDTLFRKLTQGIDTGLYGDKERAHSGPFQQDMVAYIMAIWGNNPDNDLATPRLLRDRAKEDMIFERLDQWIWSLKRDKPPTMTDVAPTLAMESLSRIYGASQAGLPTIEFPAKYERSLRQIAELQGINSKLRSQITTNEEAITAHSVRIAELMKNHEHGVLATTTDKLLVDFVTRTTRRVNSDRLKKEHPSIYADVLNVSESRKVKVSIQPA